MGLKKRYESGIFILQSHGLTLGLHALERDPTISNELAVYLKVNPSTQYFIIVYMRNRVCVLKTAH